MGRASLPGGEPFLGSTSQEKGFWKRLGKKKKIKTIENGQYLWSKLILQHNCLLRSFCLPSMEYDGVPSLPNRDNLASKRWIGPGLASLLNTTNERKKRNELRWKSFEQTTYYKTPIFCQRSKQPLWTLWHHAARNQRKEADGIDLVLALHKIEYTK